MPHLSRSNLRPTQYARDTNMFRRIGDKFRTIKSRNRSKRGAALPERHTGNSRSAAFGFFIFPISRDAGNSTTPRISRAKGLGLSQILEKYLQYYSQVLQ